MFKSSHLLSQISVVTTNCNKTTNHLNDMIEVAYDIKYKNVKITASGFVQEKL